MDVFRVGDKASITELHGQYTLWRQLPVNWRYLPAIRYRHG